MSDERLPAWARSQTVAEVVVSVVVLVALGGGFYITMRLAGIVDAVIYWVLFLVVLTFVPTLVGLMGRATPFHGFFGTLQWTLGMLAADIGILVERGSEWEMCPGKIDAGEYYAYVDGEWVGPIGSSDNLAIVGWKLFGIALEKDDGTLASCRVDNDVHSATEVEIAQDAGTAELVGDGAGATVERGGYEQVNLQRHDGLADDSWLLDLKRYYQGGLPRIGDTELIEKAEEVAKREEIAASRVGDHSLKIGAAVGLLLGILTGFGYIWVG